MSERQSAENDVPRCTCTPTVHHAKWPRSGTLTVHRPGCRIIPPRVGA